MQPPTDQPQPHIQPVPPAEGNWQPSAAAVAQPVPSNQAVTSPVVANLSTANSPVAKQALADRVPHLLFFYGFTSIFLINFVNAVVDPKSFMTLLSSNVFVPSFLPGHILVDIAAINDLTLGVLILTQWRKKWVYAWAGTWLLIVAITKAGHFLA